MANKENKRKKSLKRDLIEWGIIVGVIAILYITGLHTVVLGGLQSLILKTGLIRPNLHPATELGTTNYRFSLMNQDGNIIPGNSLRGQVVFMNFWATWCPPCVAEMPDINRLYKSMEKDSIRFLMVSVDNDFAKARNFVSKKGFSFPIYGPASGMPAEFSGNVVPTTYIISPDGRIMMKREGMAEYNTESLRNFLRSLEKKNP